MPIHDWRRVEAGIFHDFHHEWIASIKHALNRGLLPRNYYAMAEQLIGGYGPDVLALEAPEDDDGNDNFSESGRGGTALAEVQPKVFLREQSEDDIYAAKANRIAIRHVSHHRVVAVIEIVSPGNKTSIGAMNAFAEKAAELLRQGIHLLVIDLFPPTPRDPLGIHPAIWGQIKESRFQLLPDRPLTLVSYIGGMGKEAFVEPVAVGAPLPDMPLFISRGYYVMVPLEATYQLAWEAVPSVWRQALH